MEPSVGLFQFIGLTDTKNIRELIIDAILGTDMRFHFQHLKALEILI